ncbi:ABC transporter substrate-binding protein [Conexibacter sp. CPCC 206217]|uniref:ABC transporter substrate-binding protein n=1 Tax=Conexibacter sp. CPCC 206217 TaxID=3064574 RepID=UPI00271752A4|nr:hypothetical protein [Conexibacter sp. CPCC 206217]MDO8212138.1 hypothetical protein [Conexibacter sp. CPCC 206217]
MTLVTSRTKIAILPSAPVFTLPEQVAEEEGLFEREGLDTVVTDDWHWQPQGKHGWEAMFDRFREHGAHTYNMCEWGVINQIEQGVERNAKIAYLRPAVTAQAIVSYRPEIQEPHDLVDQPVGVAKFTGQHYTTLQLLEGGLRREQIDLRYPKSMDDILSGAREGDLAAVTVMEPFLSLALKEGAHIVALTFYRGGQIFGSAVPDAARSAYVRAVNGAVDLINADRDRYRAHVAKQTGGRLAPEELSLAFHRYSHAKPFDLKRFEETYSWMQSWDLADGQNTYESIVAPII